MAARSVLAEAQLAYEAARPSRARKFARDVLSPNQIVERSALGLRAQARHLERNHDIARGILRTMVNNIVGPQGIGVEPQPRRADGTIHQEYAAALREAWRDWCRKPEVTQRHHFARAQRMLCKAWLRDGESFAQELVGPVQLLEHGTRVPYSLELFEADLIPFEYDDLPRVYQGIERNAWGRPVAYWSHRGHPQDYTNYNLVFVSRRDLKRIPADRVHHIALLDRLHQMRGLSEFGSVITRLEDIKDYEESERVAAKVAAALTGYVKRNSPDGFAGDVATDEAGNAIGRDLRMQPGTIIDTLQVGEEIGLIDSKRPNPNVVTFRQGQLRATAAGVGASYSSIARDYNGTFSAQRQELVEQWTNYATLTDEFVGQFVRPVFETFVQVAHVSGVVPIPRDLRAGSEDDALFVGQSMPWIDPLKEANAWVTLVKAGFASEVEVMRRRGVNPRDLLEQVATWRQECAQKGVLFDSDAAVKFGMASMAADGREA